jgi:YidC/Oxa1 family membrane protein insertase
MQALQRLSPQIKELQQKYKDDKQRLNQEMMKFYQENKVNPFASCLPLLAQMPIFLALFYLLREDLREDICNQSAKPCGEVDPGSAQFLFIPDLTDTATGGVLVVLIVAYVVSQLFSGLAMTVSADKNQRRLMLALPLVFVPFIIQFPTGLILYWITTNLWTILQAYIVRRRVGPLRPPQPAEAMAALGVGGGGGSGSGGGASERAKAKPRSRQPPPPPRKRSRKRSGRRR